MRCQAHNTQNNYFYKKNCGDGITITKRNKKTKITNFRSDILYPRMQKCKS